MDSLTTKRNCAHQHLRLYREAEGFGTQGTVDLRREEEKFSFDKWEMALASKPGVTN